MATEQDYIRPKVYRAGMVCYRIVEGKTGDDSIEMLFMRPSDPTYGTDTFQLPKGRIDEGETALEAAIRETKEETGLFMGSLLREPEEVGIFMGRTTMFTCKVEYDALFGEPSFETAETKWMTIHSFLNEGRELHRPVVQAIYREILRLEGRHAEASRW